MQIKKIAVKNFKSFKTIDINPGKFNVLIGPNAAGKSNFLSIFKFIRDIVNFGLSNAISLQGGVEYLRNMRIGTKQNKTSFHIEVDNSSKLNGMKKIGDKIFCMRSLSFATTFEIEYTNDADEFHIASDSLIQHYELYEITNGEDVSVGTVVLEMQHSGDKIITNFVNNTTCHITQDDILPTIFINVTDFSDNFAKTKTLFIENQCNVPHPESVRKILGRLSIYDLDPTQSRSVSSIAGKMELEENGENIAIVLRRILKNKEQTRQLFNYLNYVLPFIEDIEVEKFLDRHLQVKIKEKYTPGEFIPASLLSSGSIFLLSIIIVLFFEDKKTVIFEEPGRRVHPHLISRIIDMMKDASQRMQIFLTTHNPEIVKYAGLDNIFYLTRDKEGFSTIAHLSTHEEIKEFMKNEIGIEELYIQNLLS
ncbi:MAG: AAA family ATPase [Ignavibacteria bacterium]|jgi:predicted ATPase|nr:AAA family ATPase [Ignavibacteria bacterium]